MPSLSAVGRCSLRHHAKYLNLNGLSMTPQCLIIDSRFCFERTHARSPAFGLRRYSFLNATGNLSGHIFLGPRSEFSKQTYQKTVTDIYFVGRLLMLMSRTETKMFIIKNVCRSKFYWTRG